MVQPRADEAVAHAVPEVAARNQGRNTTTQAAGGYHRRLGPNHGNIKMLRPAHTPDGTAYQRGRRARGEAAPEAAFLAHFDRHAGQGDAVIVDFVCAFRSQQNSVYAAKVMFFPIRALTEFPLAGNGEALSV